MNQTYSSLFSSYSRSCLDAELEDILKSSRIVTISVGIYFPKYYRRYSKLKDLGSLFARELEGIIPSDSMAFCVHSSHTTIMYLYNDCEDKNYDICYQVFMQLKKLQNALKTICFGIGIDQRAACSIEDVMISELMSCFRMFNNISETVDREIIYMDKGLNIIKLSKELLNYVIEYSNYNLHSEDVIAISNRLDMLMNRYIYSCPNMF